jgi:hypothetical protein
MLSPEQPSEIFRYNSLTRASRCAGRVGIKKSEQRVAQYPTRRRTGASLLKRAVPGDLKFSEVSA